MGPQRLGTRDGEPGSRGVRGRPAAVGMVLAGGGSLQVGAAFAVTLFDDLGPGGAAFLRLALAAVVLCALWRPRVRGLGGGPAPRRRVRRRARADELVDLRGDGPDPARRRRHDRVRRPAAVAVLGSRRPLDGLWVVLAAAGIVLLADPAAAR